MVKKTTRKNVRKHENVDLESFLDRPALFLDKLDNNRIEKLKDGLKIFYDDLKINESKPSTSSLSTTLPELIVKTFDCEQIWQQIDLQNTGKLRNFKRQCVENDDAFSKLFRLAAQDDEQDTDDDNEQLEEEANQLFNNEDSEEEQGNISDENDDDEESANDEIETTEKEQQQQQFTSNVEDKFFKLSDMEAFLDAEDKKESMRMSNYETTTPQDEDEGEIDEEINYFTEDDDEDEDDVNMQGGKCRYKGFFDPPNSSSTVNKKVTFAVDDELEDKNGEYDEGEEEDEEDDSAPASSFEARQKRLRQKIADMEQENLSGKPWQQIGEVTAKSRPENSLLEEHLLFDRATRPAPIITQQVTLSLEDTIKQRIKDKAWDDVERKIKPVTEPYKYKNDLILDQEKSKLSLSQIYENEFLKQTQKEVEETKNPKHEEIRRLMKNLFIKLDALTNYHYTPKLPASEIKVVNNMKSIAMEEVAPITVGDSDLLAPEEIKSKSRGDVKTSEERTKTDKNRERRRKKLVTKMKIKNKEEKEKRSTKVPKDKMKMLEKVAKVQKVKTDNNIGQKRNNASSAQFFAQLQSQTSTSTSAVPKKKPKTDQSRGGSIKLAS